MCNSGFLNGMSVKEAIPAAIDEVEKRGIGKRKVNYRLRDAIFSRQRYWGEPFPIFYIDGEASPLTLNELPLELPEVDKYLPTESGEPLWQGQKIGVITATLLKRAQCQVLQGAAPTICAIWIRKMTMLLFQRRQTATGGMSISI